MKELIERLLNEEDYLGSELFDIDARLEIIDCWQNKDSSSLKGLVKAITYSSERFYTEGEKNSADDLFVAMNYVNNLAVEADKNLYPDSKRDDVQKFCRESMNSPLQSCFN